MKRVRVLIVDGSSTARQTLCRLLDADRELEVVGTAASGQLALAKLSDLSPDVVLLDVAPPDREGLKTLAAMRETHPTLPVVVFSRLTERGSRTSLDALQLGASDYVTKPESNADIESCIRVEVIAKIKSFVGAQHGSWKPESQAKGLSQATIVSPPPLPLPSSPSNPSLALPASIRQIRSHTAEIVAIATSTGGPNALASLLSSLPKTFNTPIVIVQHMASGFTASLAESLRRQTGRDVREVETRQSITAASVWVASGGRHLVVTRQGMMEQVVPNDDPPENGCRPSADVMFRSVADYFGSRCLAVVLTGMGYDGLAGCRAIRQAGGTVLVQDEASSVAWGMPGQVATAGLADMMLPLTDLSLEICRRTTSDRVRLV